MFWRVLLQWLGGYLTFTYERLSDTDLETYFALSDTPAGRDLNRALFAGFYAIVAATADRFEQAAIAIVVAMLLDGFDGNEAALEELKKIHPVQRIGYPEEVAKLALFLAEDNNGFIHGANISLDGGISSVLKDL